MADVKIKIYYNPTDEQWSLGADGATANGNVVQLKDKGDTSLQWTIDFPPDVTVDEDIAFSTDPDNPGIQFSGTPPWPGTPAEGNAKKWTASVNNTQTGQQYYFKVNAVLSGDGSDQPISWDPEVQEDPPNIVI